MFEFFDRLVAAALPRIRDFRGVSPRAFDGRGNYSLGVADQTIFPEIELDKIYQGRVVTIKEFGAFVEVFPGQDGLVHVSELAMPKGVELVARLSKDNPVVVTVTLPRAAIEEPSAAAATAEGAAADKPEAAAADKDQT